MAKEKISRTKYDEMRSCLSKKKNTKINLDDYEVDEPVSHHSNDNEDMKRILKGKQNMKNTINEARRPANKQVGQHLFKGLRYDSNGNPLYTCDTLSNEEAQAMGWRFSPKYGLYGQLSDPTMFYESKKNTIRLTESELKHIISETVKKILKENDGYNPEATEYFINDINTCSCKMTDVYNIGEEDDVFAIITDIRFSNGNEYHVYIDCDFDGNIVHVSGCFYGENYPNEDGLEFKPLDRANLQKLTSLLQNDIWDCMDNYYDE